MGEAAKIIRRDILGYQYEEFKGKFSAGCQEAFVPKSVQALLSMILCGPAGDRAYYPHFFTGNAHLRPTFDFQQNYLYT